MSNLTHWNGNSAEVQALKQELGRRLGNIELASKVTELAISEMGGLHRYGAEKVATTVETAQHLVKAADYAGRMTPQKMEEFVRTTEEYFSDVLKITDETAAELVDGMFGP